MLHEQLELLCSVPGCEQAAKETSVGMGMGSNASAGRFLCRKAMLDLILFSEK